MHACFRFTKVGRFPTTAPSKRVWFLHVLLNESVSSQASFIIIILNPNFIKMANLDLSKYGITGVTEIVHNPSYEQLYTEETKSELEGFEKGQVTELGAVNVMTGVYTGRSPKDKFFVMDDVSKDTIWWTSD